jgi:type IV pilus assembly protein PilM
VLLVAAKKDRIDDRAAVIAQTGRKPAVIDIEAFALANAYEMNYPERSDALAALIHIGRGVTIVCLLEKGEPVFTRDISIGGQVHIDAVMRELGHTVSMRLAARRILHGQFPSDVLPEQVAAVLREASAQLVLEVRKTVDFYRATARSKSSAASSCRAARIRQSVWSICWRASSARRWTSSIRSVASPSQAARSARK